MNLGLEKGFDETPLCRTSYTLLQALYRRHTHLTKCVFISWTSIVPSFNYGADEDFSLTVHEKLHPSSPDRKSMLITLEID